MRDNLSPMTALTRGDLTVEFAETGPRVTGLRFRGGVNLFAELPGIVIERPDGPPFRFLGGHRLWRAPEIPEVTYLPDDGPVTLVEGANTVSARGVTDPRGVMREIEATITAAGAVIVDHRIVNMGRWPIEAAAWAITQFPPEGAAVLPIVGASGGDDEYQANRSIVLWPYTNPGAPGLNWSSEAVVIEGSDGPKQKIGTENRAGWVAYHHGEFLFAKWAPLHEAAQPYSDRGASIQVYRDQRFIELETLGPFRTVDPGAAIGHREIWRVVETGPISRHELAARAMEILGESTRGAR